MGQGPYICENCGGGDYKCCREDCKAGCEGGQCCWSDYAICIMDRITVEEKMVKPANIIDVKTIDMNTISAADYLTIKWFGRIVDLTKMTANEFEDMPLLKDMVSRKEYDEAKTILDRWKGIPLKMEYNAEGGFTCETIPDTVFVVDEQIYGDRFNRDYGVCVHVKAWCLNCWSPDKKDQVFICD